MKIPTFAALLASFPLLHASAQAATAYVDVFGGVATSADPNDIVPLTSLGWTQSNPGINPSDPISYVWVHVDADLNPKGNAAFIGGGAWGVPTNDNTYTVGRSFTDLDLADTIVSFDLAIEDAWDLSDPDWGARDTFGFTLKNNLGASLITVNLAPIDQDEPTGRWLLSYAFGSDPLTSSGWWLTPNDGIGTFAGFALTTSATGLGLEFPTTDGIYADAESISGYDPLSGELYLEFFWDNYEDNGKWGDNYMFITNLNVVPEPSSALLLSCGALALLRRRRSS